MSTGRRDPEILVSPLAPNDLALLSELLPPLDDRPGPARRRSAATSGAMVQAVIEAALAEREAPTLAMDADSLRPPAWSTHARSRGRTAVLIAASVALVSLGAGAAVLVAKVMDAPAEREAPPAPRRASRPAPARVEEPVVAPEPETELEVVEPEAEAPAVASVAVEPPAAAVKRPARAKRHRAAKVATAPAAGPSWLEEVDLASAPLEDLLALANRLRRGKQWGAADEVYRTVSGRFPGSDAAVVAEIASATLRVEKLRDAKGALAGYRRALGARPTGALAEEARWGVVEALRALGDGTQEIAALHEFLDHHPLSALAPAARRRAAELSP